MDRFAVSQATASEKARQGYVVDHFEAALVSIANRRPGKAPFAKLLAELRKHANDYHNGRPCDKKRLISMLERIERESERDDPRALRQVCWEQDDDEGE